MSTELPEGWKWVKFEDLLDYLQPTNYIVETTDYHKTFKTPVLTAGKSFIIGYTNETHGIFNALPVIIFDDFTTSNKFVNFPFKVKSSAMKILKPKDSSVSIMFVYYYIQTVRVSFDTHKRYWISVFSKLPVPLPPQSVQEKIVSKIEELFSELDKGIENLKIAQEQLKVYRQSVLKWAFDGRLTNENVEDGQLPNGWVNKKFNHIGTWKGGGTPSKSNKAFWDSGSICWVSPKDMKTTRIFQTEDKITSDAIQQSSTKLIGAKSILFVVRSGILRRTLPVALTMCDVTVNQDIQALTLNETLPEYVLYFVLSENDNIRNLCSKDGTTVESIDSTLLKNYEIPICSSTEQVEVVQQIESRLSVADKMEENINENLLKSESLRQSILKNAFEGKLNLD